MRTIERVFMIGLLLMLVICFGACGSSSDQEQSSTRSETQSVEEESSKTENRGITPENLEIEPNDDVLQKYSKDDEEGFLDADFSAATDITFSVVDDESWKYSHNKREFPIEPCYAKINNTAITKHFWGKKDEIGVYFVFSGTERCTVELSKGKGEIEQVDSDDSNTIVFKKTLEAAKSKKAETIESEFKLTPKEACGLRIDVIYDASVPRKYDQSSTIYFTNNAEE